MLRLLLGSLVAAAATFIMGFVFYATPVSERGYKTASPQAQAAVQAAINTLPETGTYFIPYGETPEATARARAGPTALVQVNREGAEPMDPMTFIGGFLHMALSMFVLGLFLWLLRGALPTFFSRIMPVIFIAGVAAIWTRLGQPIWFHTDWPNAAYLAVVDFLSLAVGGLIMALFIPKPARR